MITCVCYIIALYSFHFISRLSCIVWEKDQCKKVELSVPDLGGLIERQVAKLCHEPVEMFYTGVIFTLLIGSFPFLFRLYSSPSLRELIFMLVTKRSLPNRTLLHEVLTTTCGASWQVLKLPVHLLRYAHALCVPSSLIGLILID